MAIAPPFILGLLLIPFPRVFSGLPPGIQRHYRPSRRRIRAAFSAKNAPFLYGFSLALVYRAIDNDNAERLFALAAALPAKGVILPSPIIANKQAPFLTRLFG